ncbi:MAG: sigma-70 family RNA polymerase sigma factor [Chloroflexi bacterium]|nr:sigma-70 family RNA polymerase sigma factor [Chloroflexota bacterium]
MNSSEAKRLINGLYENESSLRRQFAQRYRKRDEVSDAFQSAVAELWKGHSRLFFENPTLLRAWLFKVLGNKLNDRHRVRCAGKRGIGRENPNGGEIIENVIDKGPGPDETLISNEGIACIQAFVRGLDVESQGIWNLRMDQDMSYAEIAEQLGILAATVRVRIYRMKMRLREELIGDE